MRNIIFKAKTLQGEWVEGNYYESKMSGCYILAPYIKTRKRDGVIIGDSFNAYEIDPETICQFTGLVDKNGRKIWENDVLRGFIYPFLHDGKFNYFATVEWSEDNKYFFLYTIKNPDSTVRGISEENCGLLEDFDSQAWEVIGNVFDNPELLEERNEQ